MTSRRRQASLPLARCIPAPKKKRPTRRDGYTRRRRPLPDLPHSIAYQLTGLSAVAAILAGMRLHRPARRGIWYGLAGGLSVFVAGDVTYSVYVYVLHREPFPSPADGLYLASYPLLAAALLVGCSQVEAAPQPGGDRSPGRIGTS